MGVLNEKRCKNIQILEASLPWFGKNIWVRPMTVEPYKDPLDIATNSQLRKNNLETQKSEKNSTIFSISSTNNKLNDYEGTNCSTRKTFFNLIRLPHQNKKYKHKFDFLDIIYYHPRFLLTQLNILVKSYEHISFIIV